MILQGIFTKEGKFCEIVLAGGMQEINSVARAGWRAWDDDAFKASRELRRSVRSTPTMHACKLFLSQIFFSENKFLHEEDNGVEVYRIFPVRWNTSSICSSRKWLNKY